MPDPASHRNVVREPTTSVNAISAQLRAYALASETSDPRFCSTVRTNTSTCFVPGGWQSFLDVVESQFSDDSLNRSVALQRAMELSRSAPFQSVIDAVQAAFKIGITIPGASFAILEAAVISVRAEATHIVASPEHILILAAHIMNNPRYITNRGESLLQGAAALSLISNFQQSKRSPAPSPSVFDVMLHALNSEGDTHKPDRICQALYKLKDRVIPERFVNFARYLIDQRTLLAGYSVADVVEVFVKEFQELGSQLRLVVGEQNLEIFAEESQGPVNIPLPEMLTEARALDETSKRLVSLMPQIKGIAKRAEQDSYVRFCLRLLANQPALRISLAYSYLSHAIVHSGINANHLDSLEQTLATFVPSPPTPNAATLPVSPLPLSSSQRASRATRPTEPTAADEQLFTEIGKSKDDHILLLSTLAELHRLRPATLGAPAGTVRSLWMPIPLTLPQLTEYAKIKARICHRVPDDSPIWVEVMELLLLPDLIPGVALSPFETTRHKAIHQDSESHARGYPELRRMRDRLLNRAVAQQPEGTSGKVAYFQLLRDSKNRIAEYQKPQKMLVPPDVIARGRTLLRISNYYRGFSASLFHARRLPDKEPALLTRMAAAIGKLEYLNALDTGKFPGRGISLSGIDTKQVLGVAAVEKNNSGGDSLKVYRDAWPWLSKALDRLGRTSYVFVRGMYVVGCKSKSFELSAADDVTKVHCSLAIFSEHFKNGEGLEWMLVPTIILRTKLGSTLIPFDDYTGPSLDVPDLNKQKLTPQDLRMACKALNLPFLDGGQYSVLISGFAGESPFDRHIYSREAAKELRRDEAERFAEYLKLIDDWQKFQIPHHAATRDQILSEAAHFDVVIGKTAYMRALTSREQQAHEAVREYLNLLDLLRIIEARFYKGYIGAGGEAEIESEDNQADINASSILMLNHAKAIHGFLNSGELKDEDAPVLVVTETLNDAAIPAQPLLILDPKSLKGRIDGMKMNFSQDPDDLEDSLYWMTSVMPKIRPDNLTLRFVHRDSFDPAILENL